MLCNFLKNVDLLKPLGNQETTKIARALRAGIYNDGEYIIRQGDEGEVFYMIYKGTVICTRNEEDGHERELIRLGPGEFFGERALQKKEKRAANCIACGDVECFTLSLEQVRRRGAATTSRERQRETESRQPPSQPLSLLNPRFAPAPRSSTYSSDRSRT
jgi:CRP-like cAMP-binding protein